MLARIKSALTPHDSPTDAEVEAEARRLCLSECRAALCVDGGRCLNTWPGNGSGGWFGSFITKARAALAEGNSQEATTQELASAISRSYGENPDDMAPLTRMCTADNEPVPNWQVYAEQAAAIRRDFDVRAKR